MSSRVTHRLLRERLTTEPLRIHPGMRESDLEWLTHSLKTIQNAPTVEATNVSDYYFRGTDTEVWYPLEDFPNVLPPFPTMWIEHHAPEEIVSKEFGTVPWGRERCALWGTLFITQELPGIFAGTVEREAPRQNIFVRMPDGSEAPREVHGVKWVVVGHTYMAFRDGSKLILTPPALQTIAYLKPNGALAELAEGSGMPALDVIPPVYIMTSAAQKLDMEALQDMLQEYIEKARTFVYTSLLAISFMHCRNVVYSDVPPTSEERIAAKKRGQPDPITYKVLELEPFKPTKRRSLPVGTDPGEDIRHKSLHIVRGNFATYDDKPLFGRVRGTFWRPMHIRGSAEQGVAIRDYSIDLKGKDNGEG